MLEDSKIVKASENISSEDKEEVSGILRYFEANHSLEDVKYLPEDFKIGDMNMVFGFPYVDKNLYQYNYFHYYSEQIGKNIEVKGYRLSIRGLWYNG